MTENRHAKLVRAYLECACDLPVHIPPPTWPDWLRATFGGPLAVGAALGVAACGGTTVPSDQGVAPTAGASGTDHAASSGGVAGTEDVVRAGGAGGTGGVIGIGGTMYGTGGSIYVNPWEDCTDGVDNNDNGRVDCADAYCASDPACIGAGGGGAGGAAGARTDPDPPAGCSGEITEVGDQCAANYTCADGHTYVLECDGENDGTGTSLCTCYVDGQYQREASEPVFPGEGAAACSAAADLCILGVPVGAGGAGGVAGAGGIAGGVHAGGGGGAAGVAGPGGIAGGVGAGGGGGGGGAAGVAGGQSAGGNGGAGGAAAAAAGTAGAGEA